VGGVLAALVGATVGQCAFWGCGEFAACAAREIVCRWRGTPPTVAQQFAAVY
jgi:hypothetical protein